MMKRLLASWAVLMILVGVAGAAYVPSTAPLRALMPAAATVRYVDCGFINAFYEARTRTITVCTENAELAPAVQRFIILHEMAHAVIDQQDIPYTGSEETAADEYAALMLIENGEYEAVIEVGQYWLKRATAEDPFDDHPGAVRRGGYLMCMAMQGGAGMTNDICYINYYRIKASWLELLNAKRIQ